MDDAKERNVEGVTSFRDVLQKWNDYYINNDFGIGIQCDKCKKWRRVFQYEDESEVPEVWTCDMWEIDNKRKGNCKMPSLLTEDDLVDAKFVPGSMVWAKMDGFDWWPGMVEDCPDTQEYFLSYIDDEAEDEYHVTFFGSIPLRSWICVSRIMDFHDTPPADPKRKKKSKGLEYAIEQANEAALLSNKERLMQHSFLVRYKGRWKKVRNPARVTLPPTCSDMKTSKESTESISGNANKKSSKGGSSSQTLVATKKQKDETKSKAAAKRKFIDVDEESQASTNQNEMAGKNDSGNHLDKPGVEEKQNSSGKGNVPHSDPKRPRHVKPQTFKLEQSQNTGCQEPSLNEGNEQSDDSAVSSDRENFPTSKTAAIYSDWQDEPDPPLCFPAEESSSDSGSEESDAESLTDNEAKDNDSFTSETDIFLKQNDDDSASNHDNIASSSKNNDASCSVNSVEDSVHREKLRRHWEIADAIINKQKCLPHSRM
ncbi:zinc finger CW-type PWWP domain protein 1-like [Argiope bruennichi]|uniref:zinc finger CW-type PWWP domain protein 1-like n=1 Tax=Argiope bruennichi TaxID=94029 RepID=UPI00249439DC|nr:zinc finger CW-type PWWP domain protein 1-like [Argiope bruennichi]